MDKLENLLLQCKCGIYLTINQHRDVYQTVEERIEELNCFECPPTISSDEIKIKMIETDTIIDLQFYPDTPIGSYHILHWNLNEVLNEALHIIKEENNGRRY